MTIEETKRDILTRTRDILHERGRCKGISVDLAGGQVCLGKALILALDEAELERDTRLNIYTQLQKEITRTANTTLYAGGFFPSIPFFNDALYTTDADVFKVIDETIQSLSLPEAPAIPEIEIKLERELVAV